MFWVLVFVCVCVCVCVGGGVSAALFLSVHVDPRGTHRHTACVSIHVYRSTHKCTHLQQRRLERAAAGVPAGPVDDGGGQKHGQEAVGEDEELDVCVVVVGTDVVRGSKYQGASSIYHAPPYTHTDSSSKTHK